mmetsp:Transcript_63025/g.138093  ORF Transcript_63025/g.138093 Transcript_63025/m.138093 type:complete len:434 (-) Transcript_63025:104-1405(-)
MSDRSQLVNRSAQEHLMYIQEKVNPVLEALVTAVLLERPDDPSFFMLRWLCEQTKSLDGAEQGQRTSTAEEIETVQAEIKRLQERKSELLAILGIEDSSLGSGMDIKSERSTKANDESEEDEDEDEEPEDLPENLRPVKPRQSVSAEAYGAWNQKAAFVPPVYEKTADQKERIEKCLASNFLFHALEKKDLATIILAFQEKAVEPGETVIQEGDDGQSMFLIEEGSAECFKKQNDEQKLVKTCSAGDIFGELALLYNCPRAATVICKEKGTLWELDRETFNNIVKDAAAERRETLSHFLKEVPLFSSIDEYELMTIADAMKVVLIEEEGTEVIKQGDIGDCFFIVMEGECVAMKAFVDGQEPQKVMTHKVGDYFGELSLISNAPRAASIVTSSNVQLMSMDRKTFKRLMGPIVDILQREAVRYDTPCQSSSGV